MKKRVSRLTALALASALGAGTILAVPADPTPRTVTQPDGTKVTLSLRGDEYFHCYETEDGYIVGQAEDGWYRIVGNDGLYSDMPALNAADRSASDIRKLSSISAESAWTKMRRHAELATPSRRAYREARIAPNRVGASKAYEAKWDNADRHFLRAFPCEGTQKVLTILVSFSDQDWSYCDDPHTEMSNMLRQPGYNNYGCTGSVFDFFNESSRGVFTPEFDVYGPVKLPQKVSYYGGNDYSGNDANAHKMVIDACSLLDDQIDFSQYDRDGDGIVDNIYIFYAGYGEADGGAPSTVYHSWDLQYAGEGGIMHDGVTLGHYACSNELNGESILTGIGTFCHEFSHVLGLPDLYATSYTGAHTPGKYSLMDGGSYNNNGRTPPIYSAYERYALEWQKPFLITKGEEIRTRALTAGGNTYKMVINTAKPTEYYLFENRQPIGNDVTLPGKGLLAWRVDFKEQKWATNSVNNEPGDQCVDIIEADGGYSDQDTGGATFPGIDGVTEFSASSRPAFANKNGDKSSLGLSEITSAADGMVSFKVGDGVSEESDYAVEKPYSKPVSVSSDSFTISVMNSASTSREQRAENEEKESLILSVEKQYFDAGEEIFRTEALKGYTMVSLPAGSEYTVSGLEPSTNYNVKVYRENEANMSQPYSYTIITAGATVAESRTQLRAESVRGNDATLAWTAIDGADRYLLTVATRVEEPSTDNFTTGFTGTPRLPKGWQSMGVFSSQAGNYGELAPSFYMSEADDFLWTEYYADKEISSISLWTRKNADNLVKLAVYAADKKGGIDFIGYVEGITKTGQMLTLENIPSDTHALVFRPDYADGTRIFLDDITINFRGKCTDTPVGEYADMPLTATETQVTGLSLNTDYVAYVKAHDGEMEGPCSNTLKFTTGSTTSIADPAADDRKGYWIDAAGVVHSLDTEAAYDVMTIDGSVMARSVKGSYTLPHRGIYLLRTGTEAVKIVY